MDYLKRRRSQLILVAFVIFALAARFFPSVDLQISSLFFDGNAFPRDAGWQKFLHHALNVFLVGSLLLVTALFTINRIWGRQLGGVNGRKVAYLFLVLAIGGGLIVNVALKDNFHRARPRNVVEFGGARQFTPAFVISNQCNKNCSFSSGDAAGGFFAIALAMVFARRPLGYAAAAGVGVAFSLARVASGAHFFSDTVTSFFVMLIVSDVLYHYMLLRRSGLQPTAVDEISPALVAVSSNSSSGVPKNWVASRSRDTGQY